MGAVLSKLCFKCPRELFGESFLPKKPLFFFINFRFSADIFRPLYIFSFSNFDQFFFINFEARVSKLYFKCAEELFGEMNKFEKLILFFFGNWAKIRRPFTENFSTGMWIMHSTCPEKHLGEENFFKILVCSILFWFLPKKLKLLSENFRRCCQSCTLSNHRNLLSKNIFFWKKYFFFSTVGVRAEDLGFFRNLSAVFWQFSFAVSKAIFWEKKTFFYRVRSSV